MMPKKMFHIRIKFNILDSKAVSEEIFNSPFFIDSMVTDLIQCEQSVQGDITSIEAVLPPATRVKNFDHPFLILTLDFG